MQGKPRAGMQVPAGAADVGTSKCHHLQVNRIGLGLRIVKTRSLSRLLAAASLSLQWRHHQAHEKCRRLKSAPRNCRRCCLCPQCRCRCRQPHHQHGLPPWRHPAAPGCSCRGGGLEAPVLGDRAKGRARGSQGAQRWPPVAHYASWTGCGCHPPCDHAAGQIAPRTCQLFIGLLRRPSTSRRRSS